MSDAQSSHIDNDTKVNVTVWGDNVEVNDAKVPTEQVIMNLPNGRYVDLRTGEVKNRQKQSEVRTDNLNKVRQTMRNLRRIIGHNFSGLGDESVLWVTLTYATPAENEAQLMPDFELFIRNLRNRFGKLEYLAVIEPQPNRSDLLGMPVWHLHVLLKYANGADLTIPNENVAKAWGKGFTKTKRVDSSDNISAYLMAYLTDLELPGMEGQFNEKRFKKGLKLYLYPAGIHIYRKSRGIVTPKSERLKMSEVRQKYDLDGKLGFQKEVQHKIDDERSVTVTTEIYNNVDMPLT